LGVTPRSGAPSDKRPVIKRPAMRTPATGDAKRSKLGDGDKVSRMWDKVLKPGEAGAAGSVLPGAAGAANLIPLPAADAHLRRVFVSDLPPNVDEMELRNVRVSCAERTRAHAPCVARCSTCADVTRRPPHATAEHVALGPRGERALRRALQHRARPLL
jgi:hypothetical protein